MASSKAKALRFAALIRVSTERQEKVGESLRTQTSQINDAAIKLSGKKVSWYGGQEHATPNHEKQQVDKLVHDSTKAKFDAVIVAHEDRWSRDNVKSTQGLDTFQAHKVRFFVDTRECNLSDPTARFMLAQHAVIGQYHAENQAKKSIENRIERAKRGIPTGGKKPFGRIWNKLTSQWEIIPAKQAMIKDVAKRYLAGESMPELAKEYNVNHSNLCKIFRERCGTHYTETFSFPKFDIHEVVTFTIPRLLPERTIAAVKKLAKLNRTYNRNTVNQYLLSHYVYCEHCGYSLCGQTNHPNTKFRKKRYYRHAHNHRNRKCNVTKTWVAAQQLEDEVIYWLFDTFGNPTAVERAIKAAIPNQGEILELQQQQQRIQAALARITSGQQRLVDHIADGVLTKDQAKRKMHELTEQEATHQDQLIKINDQLEHLPSNEYVRTVSNEIVQQLQQCLFPAKRSTRKLPGMIEYTVKGKKKLSSKLDIELESLDNQTIDDMSYEDKRALVEAVFAGKTHDGKPAGIYINWQAGTRWKFQIRGLIEPKHIGKTKGTRGRLECASH